MEKKILPASAKYLSNSNSFNLASSRLLSLFEKEGFDKLQANAADFPISNRSTDSSQ
ncbi:hypothetical protein [Pseudoalteromonas luteoviolacea]|uniref:Uncharacterized protein n=1 Tax=Pseudoalteromonas luteoviolacea DSM 6061 TaxID=1365250 RepID=A0A166YH44_9GAMM|nr:hypothetical protein [Pseudoalteromonas luteoviolacea]KZN42623.1 hypothetical protein N475_09845 [Pseudoalteromonas luteoviolacea DSM 6061]KZN59965.1 hypothetical protein N474_06110 [Pseudoalteromonas luteoviolacea CPMOR-2]